MIQKDRISIHITSKDRHSELALLLQSLRDQTYKKWDLVLLDDASGVPISNNYFLSKLLDQIRLENHFVKVIRVEHSQGVCFARNTLIDKDHFGNEFICRLDDDVIINKDYLKLLVGMMVDYDIASGITPNLGMPQLAHKYDVDKGINKIEINDYGDITRFDDHCYMTMEEGIYTADHFRSCCMYKSHLNIHYPKFLSPVGFREESFFSLQAIWEKKAVIGINSKAIAWHLACPSGGTRYPNYTNMVQSDDQAFKDWVKTNFKKYGWDKK